MLMLASVFGLGSVVTTWPWSLDVIRIIGASWLVWLSLRFFRAAIQPNRAGSESQAAPISRPFRLVEAFLFQWINPKGIIAAVSSAGAYIAISDNVWQRAAILTTVFVSAGTICCGTWTVAGDAMNRYLSSGKSAVWTNGLMGVLIVATAALILFG